jgi:hypothetical protein
MENRKDPVKSKALVLVSEKAIVKKPEVAVQPQNPKPAAFALSVRKDAYLEPASVVENGPPLPQYRSWEWETAQNEKPVKILSYMGSLPNQFGNDGDFYVDEMTNMLYGPKKDGQWPENGVLAAGLCKRTWIAFNRMRVPSKVPERGFLISLKAFFRRILSLKSVFRTDNEKTAV